MFHRQRKWKSKLKDWGYLKKLNEDDMKIVVAKVDKRSREGKHTVVSHAGSKITIERMRNFKRRKTVKDSEAATPSAGKRLFYLFSSFPFSSPFLFPGFFSCAAFN